ncbi:hypothetical protein CCR85_03860 [Rhodothalassium salexigens]|uniref:OmpA/MotB family protein n=1 Tax=Rhodothalassium salexigens TaxID=1086 RepID=UPI0019130EED|nr:OmpA family protein [Rhodothalassium salexigens]MBK5910628.1 hypothetical protein [Rhodothalassium salexigens]MBK5920611.1 hypothetical protein [Rhodothalassium salexigens]
MRPQDLDPITDEADQEDSVFVSMTDMMVGLLLIFLILLLHYALKAVEVIDSADAETRARAALLTEIQGRLDTAGVAVEVSEDGSVIRLPEDQLRFDTNTANIKPQYEPGLRTVADVFARMVPCFGYLDGFDRAVCGAMDNPHDVWVESIFLEGHTDCEGAAARNWTLSSERAVEVFRFLTEQRPELAELRSRAPDLGGQRVLGVVGFADRRPAQHFDAGAPACEAFTEQQKAQNRRIDFRFVMGSPLRERSSDRRALEPARRFDEAVRP